MNDEQQYPLWQSRLRERLFEQPYPLWIDEEGILPAASLWYLMRERLETLRQHRLRAGDRVLIALPPNREFLAWMFAALWQGCTVALAPPYADVETLRQFLDTSLAVSANGVKTTSNQQFPPTPDTSFLLASSGTSSAPRFIALSAENVFSVIDSHLPHLHLTDVRNTDTRSTDTQDTDAQLTTPEHHYSAARVLSLLPLHHAFGLVIDFFTAFFAGAEIVRDASNGRDTAHILTVVNTHRITHCSMVPLLAQRLAASEEGLRMLQTLQGGVIGGAPASRALAQILAKTQLRVGYGQTEAAPGITLGQAGVWCEGYIGMPLGCETRINAEGILEFRGTNAYRGIWTERGLVRRHQADLTLSDTSLHHSAQEEWIPTNDYVRPSNDDDGVSGGYVFVGRADDNFKLSNGRFIPAPHWEALLKHRIPALVHCTNLMICTLDGKTCTVVIQVFPSATPPPSENLRHAIAEILDISPEIIGTITYLNEKDWHYTPKGSTDRRAMELYLRASTSFVESTE